MSNNNENKALAPFSCQFSPQVPELLLKLNCTIAISTYQAGKLVFISAKDEDSLSQLPRNFNKAMGIAEDFENRPKKVSVYCPQLVVLCLVAAGTSSSSSRRQRTCVNAAWTDDGPRCYLRRSGVAGPRPWGSITGSRNVFRWLEGLRISNLHSSLRTI